MFCSYLNSALLYFFNVFYAMRRIEFFAVMLFNYVVKLKNRLFGERFSH